MISSVVIIVFLLVAVLIPIQFQMADTAIGNTEDTGRGYSENGFTKVNPNPAPMPLGCTVENQRHPVVGSSGNGMSAEDAQKNITLEKSGPDGNGDTVWKVTIFPKYGITRGSVTDYNFYGSSPFYDLVKARAGFAVSKDLDIVDKKVFISAYQYGKSYYAGRGTKFNGEVYPQPPVSPENMDIIPAITEYDMSSTSASVPENIQETVQSISSSTDNADKTNQIFFKASGDTTPRAGYLPDPWRKNAGLWFANLIPAGEDTTGPGLFSDSIAVTTNNDNSFIDYQSGGRYQRKEFDKAFSFVTNGTTGYGVNAKYVLRFKTRPKSGVRPGTFSGVTVAVGSYQNANNIYAGALNGTGTLNHDGNPNYDYTGSKDPALTRNQKETKYIERYRIKITEEFKMPDGYPVEVPERQITVGKSKIIDDDKTSNFDPVSVNFRAAMVNNGSTRTHYLYFRDQASYCHSLKQILHSLNAQVPDIPGFKTSAYFRESKIQENTADLDIIRSLNKDTERPNIDPTHGYTGHGKCSQFTDKFYETRVTYRQGYLNKVVSQHSRYNGVNADNYSKVIPDGDEIYDPHTGTYEQRWIVKLNGGPSYNYNTASSVHEYSRRPWLGFGLSADMKITSDLVVEVADRNGNTTNRVSLPQPTLVWPGNNHRLKNVDADNYGPGNVVSFREGRYKDFQYWKTSYNSQTGDSSGYNLIFDQSGIYRSYRPFLTRWWNSNSPDVSQAARYAALFRKLSSDSWAKTVYPSYDYQHFGSEDEFNGSNGGKAKVAGTFLRDMGGYWVGQFDTGDAAATNILTFKFTTIRDPKHWTDGDVHRSFVMGHFKTFDNNIGIDNNDIYYQDNDYGVDSDADGINDLNECIIGSNPEDQDTDGDGRTDGVEVPDLTSASKPKKPSYKQNEKLSRTDPTVAPIPPTSLKLKFNRGEHITGVTGPNREVQIAYFTDQDYETYKDDTVNDKEKIVCTTLSNDRGEFSCPLNGNYLPNKNDVKYIRTKVWSNVEGKEYQFYEFPEVATAAVDPDAQLFPPDRVKDILTPIRVTDHLIGTPSGDAHENCSGNNEKCYVRQNIRLSYKKPYELSLVKDDESGVIVNEDGSVHINFKDGSQTDLPKEEVVYDNYEKFPFLNNIVENNTVPKDQQIDTGIYIGHPVHGANYQDRKANNSFIPRLTPNIRPQINADTDHIKIEFYDPKNNDKVEKTVHLVKKRSDGNWEIDKPGFYLSNGNKPVFPKNPTEYSQLAGQTTTLYFEDSVKPLLNGLKVRATDYDGSPTSGDPCTESDCTVAYGGQKFRVGPNSSTTSLGKAYWDIGPLKTIIEAEMIHFKYPLLTLVTNDTNIGEESKDLVRHRICIANADSNYLGYGNEQDCKTAIEVENNGKATITYKNGEIKIIPPTETVYQQLTSGNPVNVNIPTGSRVSIQNNAIYQRVQVSAPLSNGGATLTLTGANQLTKTIKTNIDSDTYAKLEKGYPVTVTDRDGNTATVIKTETGYTQILLPPDLKRPAQNWGVSYRIAKQSDFDSGEKDDTDNRDIENKDTGSSDNKVLSEVWKQYKLAREAQGDPVASNASYDYGSILSEVTVEHGTGNMALTAKDIADIDFGGSSEKTVYVPVIMESNPNANIQSLPAGHTKPPYYQSHIYFVPVTVKNPLDAQLIKTIAGRKVESQGDTLPLSVLDAGLETYQVHYQFINKTSSNVDLYDFDDPSIYGKKVAINGRKYVIQRHGSILKNGEKTLMQACFENKSAIYKDGLGARSGEKRIILAGGVTQNGSFIPAKLNCSLNIDINADINQSWRASDTIFRPIGAGEAVSVYPITGNTTLTNEKYRNMSNSAYSASYANAYLSGTDFPTGTTARQPKPKLLGSAYDVMRLGGDFRLPDTGNTGFATWLAVLLLFGLVAGATSTWAARKQGGDS